MQKLSDRIMADVDAEPWVICEIEKLEDEVAKLNAENARLKKDIADWESECQV